MTGFLIIVMKKPGPGDTIQRHRQDLVHVYWAPQQDKRTEVKLCHFNLKTQNNTFEVPHELQTLLLVKSNHLTIKVTQ